MDRNINLRLYKELRADGWPAIKALYYARRFYHG